jgi:hypothetical protein
MSDVPSDQSGDTLPKMGELKSIKTARIIIMVMAVLHLLAGAGLWLVGSWVASVAQGPQAEALAPPAVNAGEEEVKSGRKAEADEARARDRQEASKAVVDVHVIAAVALAVGLAFFVSFFWARTNPFQATLAALIIWLVGQAVDLTAAPGEFHHGLFIRILILAVLAKGVHAGWRYQKMSREIEAQA